jgi:hypothetical protein
MAFTSALIRRTNHDGLLCELHSYVNSGGGTGGAITSTLNRILFAKVIEKDAAAMAALASVNCTLPIDGATGVTIVTTADKSGWVKFYAEY